MTPRTFSCCLALAALPCFVASAGAQHSQRSPKRGASSPRITSAPPARRQPVRLEIAPAAITLDGADSSQRLLVTGVYADSSTEDLTERCSAVSLTPAIARVSGGTIEPVGDGAGRIKIGLPGAKITAQVSVQVRHALAPNPVSFTNDVIPILTKNGCNGGGCHGKSGGQNGFALSLLGFDVAADFEALVRSMPGRRVTPGDPAKSLLLQKAANTVPHGGGRRIETGSIGYRLLARWIQAGAALDSTPPPAVQRIEVTPAERTLTRKAAQRMLVTALYADGSRRDVTPQTDFKSNEDTIASVDSEGRVRTTGAPGETAVMARYQGQVAVMRVTVPMEPARPTGSSGKGASVAALPAPAPRCFVDEHAARKLRKLNVPASPLSSDSEFLRRVSLDVIGTLPTPEEARAFLADKSPNKRAAVIDRLLERPEYADFWSVKWADILRVNRSLLGNDENAQKYHEWIRESLISNKPYDRFVREIVTATGAGQINGASNFYRVTFGSKNGAQAEVTNAVSQTFLGTRIECAQCHHHPYERWSQDDFYGMAAYFTRLKSRQLAQKGDKTPKNKRAADIEYFVDDSGPASIKHPRTRQIVAPKPLDAPPSPVVGGEDPRVRLADWMTARDNPYLARAIVNRLWAHYMGRGIVEPIDDMRVTNPPSNPELLDALAADFTGHRFDIKHITRVILNSDTYQRTGAAVGDNRLDRQNFSHAYPKRLSAEVLLDAVCAVTGVPEKYAGLPEGTRAIQLWNNRTPSYFLDTFGRPLRVSSCECERSSEPNVAQALHLMNAPQLQARLASESGRAARLAAGEKPENEILDELFLAALSRFPTEDERREAGRFLKSATNRRQAIEDILWAILNGREFQFNH